MNEWNGNKKVASRIKEKGGKEEKKNDENRETEKENI